MKYTNQRNIIRGLKVKHLLLFLLLFFLLLTEVSWLIIVVILYSTIYCSVLHLIYLVKFSILRKVIKGVFLFVFTVSIAINLKLLIFDIYKIPSSSMESTLLPNDVILVNKLKYGPRLPRSPFEIPWVNIAFHFNKSSRDSINFNWWGFKRLSGNSSIGNGDIIVYEYTFKEKSVFVKRCVGIAGDTLNIKDGQVFINGEFQNNNQMIMQRYRFKVKDKKQLQIELEQLEIDRLIDIDWENPGFMKSTLSGKDVEKLKRLDIIDSLQLMIEPYNPAIDLFINLKTSFWTLDNLGPVIIPKKGMKIVLNDISFEQYKEVIHQHEKLKIEKKSGQYLANGKKITTYTFKQNYCFVMGDNRKESYDSRYIGFLPEKNIIGKVQCVLFSNFMNTFRWDRFFKPID